MTRARTWTWWNPLLLGLFALLGCGDGGPAEPNEPVEEPEPVRTPEASSCWAPSSPMLAWWPAEESAEDVVGNHHGTLTAAVRYEDGYVGKAFSLGGSEAFVRLDEAPSARSFTVEAWIRPSNRLVLRREPAGKLLTVEIMRRPLLPPAHSHITAVRYTASVGVMAAFHSVLPPAKWYTFL